MSDLPENTHLETSTPSQNISELSVQVSEPKNAGKKSKKNLKIQTDSTEDAETKSKKPKAKKTKTGDKKKAVRAPARPHRRVSQDIIEARVLKLEKRLYRAKTQVEDATRHVESYKRELTFRLNDIPTETVTDTSPKFT